MAYRYTWKRQKRSGFTAPITYSLRVNGSDPVPWLAKIQSTSGGLWFWYGSGKNTSATPTTLDECKKAAVDHIRALRSLNQSVTPT